MTAPGLIGYHAEFAFIWIRRAVKTLRVQLSIVDYETAQAADLQVPTGKVASFKAAIAYDFADATEPRQVGRERMSAGSIWRLGLIRTWWSLVVEHIDVGRCRRVMRSPGADRDGFGTIICLIIYHHDIEWDAAPARGNCYERRHFKF